MLLIRHLWVMFLFAADVNEEEQKKLGRAWILDCCIRCICVMVLDRFSDMSGDDTVAPVRETVAQVLAALYNHINADDLERILQLFFSLTKMQTQWAVRHSAFLGLKYFVAVRQDILAPLLPSVVEHAIAGLKDRADDVRAAAADTLLPVLKSNLALPLGRLIEIKDTVWEVLQELDDITASTASVMNLLGTFLLVVAPHVDDC
jgi:TATA-binding protein-associated factor